MRKQVIEFNGEAVGALLPDGERFRFVAVKYPVWALDGHLFSLPVEAKQAVAKLLSTSGHRPAAADFAERDSPRGRFNWKVAAAGRSSKETRI